MYIKSSYSLDAVARDLESTEMMCLYGVPAKHKTSDLLQVQNSRVMGAGLEI